MISKEEQLDLGKLILYTGLDVLYIRMYISVKMSMSMER